jgi:hypothetical protein
MEKIQILNDIIIDNAKEFDKLKKVYNDTIDIESDIIDEIHILENRLGFLNKKLDESIKILFSICKLNEVNNSF